MEMHFVFRLLPETLSSDLPSQFLSFSTFPGNKQKIPEPFLCEFLFPYNMTSPRSLTVNSLIPLPNFLPLQLSGKQTEIFQNPFFATSYFPIISPSFSPKIPNSHFNSISFHQIHVKDQSFAYDLFLGPVFEPWCFRYCVTRRRAIAQGFGISLSIVAVVKNATLGWIELLSEWSCSLPSWQEQWQGCRDS